MFFEGRGSEVLPKLLPSKGQIFKVGGRISHPHHTPLNAKSDLPLQSPVYDIQTFDVRKVEHSAISTMLLLLYSL